MYNVPNIEKMLTSLHQLHILCSTFLIKVFPFEFYHTTIKTFCGSRTTSYVTHLITTKLEYLNSSECFVIYKWYQQISFIVKHSIYCFKMTGKVWKKIGYMLCQGILRDTQCTLGRIWIKADHSWVIVFKL